MFDLDMASSYDSPANDDVDLAPTLVKGKAKSGRPKAGLPVWLQETAWIGAEGVASKIHRQWYGKHYPRALPCSVKKILAIPEWKGATVEVSEMPYRAGYETQIQMEREREVWTRSKRVKEAFKEWVFATAEGPNLPRTKYTLTHPCGASMVLWGKEFQP